MLKALGLPQGWRKKLLRSFGDAGSMEQVLAELTGAQRRDPLPETLAVLVAEGDESGLARMLEAEMLEAGISPGAGRSPAEIARRLIEKEDLAATRFPASALDLLKHFLEMRVSLDPQPSPCEHSLRNTLLIWLRCCRNSKHAAMRLRMQALPPETLSMMRPSGARSITIPVSFTKSGLLASRKMAFLRVVGDMTDF